MFSARLANGLCWAGDVVDKGFYIKLKRLGIFSRGESTLLLSVQFRNIINAWTNGWHMIMIIKWSRKNWIITRLAIRLTFVFYQLIWHSMLYSVAIKKCVNLHYSNQKWFCQDYWENNDVLCITIFIWYILITIFNISNGFQLLLQKETQWRAYLWNIWLQPRPMPW